MDSKPGPDLSLRRVEVEQVSWQKRMPRLCPLFWQFHSSHCFLWWLAWLFSFLPPSSLIANFLGDAP